MLCCTADCALFAVQHTILCSYYQADYYINCTADCVNCTTDCLNCTADCLNCTADCTAQQTAAETTGLTGGHIKAQVRSLRKRYWGGGVGRKKGAKVYFLEGSVPHPPPFLAPLPPTANLIIIPRIAGGGGMKLTVAAAERDLHSNRSTVSDGLPRDNNNVSDLITSRLGTSSITTRD